MDRGMIEARLTTLTEEFASGQKLLTDYDARMAGVREQLLRINGAMRVLSELLEQDGAPAAPTTASP